jgi:CRISPR/Cas system-associated exonuclease Cas4 (RecB family)
MTDTKHPITPPPELVVEWADTIYQQTECDDQRDLYVATRAAQWGADQELLACGNYLKQCAAWEEEDVTEFYNYRRPRPLSLKELALESVKRFEKSGEFFSDQMRELEFIRKALETIDD